MNPTKYGLLLNKNHELPSLKYLSVVVEVPKLSFPANERKRISHAKTQLKT